MTDTTSPHADDDELLSAHLDGQLAPDEAARLEERLAAEPALRARLGELRAAAAAIGAGVPAAPPGARERAVTVALSAAQGQDAPVVELAARRNRRSLAALSAAAVVLVLALAVPLLRAGGGDDDAGEEAAELERAEPEAAGDEASEATVHAADASGGGGEAQALGVDLGELTTPDEVAAAVADALAAGAADSTADATIESDGQQATLDDDDAVRCEDEARTAVPEAGTLALSGFATYGAEDVYVLAFDTPRGREAVVVTTAGCGVVEGPVAVPG